MAIAPGRIIVGERTKVIQPLEASVVRKVLVKDGDRVQAGQVLVELDPTNAMADKAAVQEQLKAAASELMRATVLLQALQNQKLSAPVLRGLQADLPANWSQAQAAITWTPTDQASAQAQLVSEWQDIHAKLEATLTLTLARSDMLIDGKRVHISPGMNITAEIKTGQRRIIEYLLSAVQRAGSESLRER